MTPVSVRYIVDDVDTAIDFYCGRLGFHEVMHPAPAFAMLALGDLRLALSAPGAGPGGGQAMPDGTLPQPGGWNRFRLEVDDLESTVAQLRARGANFRNEIVTGVGGKQILLEDPSGNPVELFEPILPEARMSQQGSGIATFVFRLKAPRPNFALDMSDEEREIMGRHAAYWQPLVEAGQMVVFGPVLDSTGSWGLGVVEAEDEDQLRAFAAGDPVVTTGTAEIEMGKMLAGFIRGGRASDQG